MSRLRFKVGDLCRVVSVPGPRSYHFIGCIAEVAEVGPFPAHRHSASIGACSVDSDYVIATLRGKVFCLDRNLAPIDPPAEPASLTRCTELPESRPVRDPAVSAERVGA